VSGTVAVHVNGEPKQLPAGTTVTALLAELSLGTGRCAVEINRQIVPRSAHAERILEANDRVEIVSFVGGG